MFTVNVEDIQEDFCHFQIIFASVYKFSWFLLYSHFTKYSMATLKT